MEAIKIDFYTTQDVDGARFDISGLILQVSELPFVQRRVDFGDSFVCLHDVRAEGEIILGGVLKARMTDVPEKVSRNDGLPRDLGLLADEGIVHRAHFYYDPAHCVLLLQRDRNVRPPAFVHSVAAPSHRDFGLSLIFKRDALQRLNRMQVVRKISFKVARPADPGALVREDASAGHAIELLNDLGGVEVDVKVSVGRSRRVSLHRNPALRIANLLFNHRGNEVQRIVVSGKEDPGAATETLDLLEDRLVFAAPVDQRGRRIDTHECQRLLVQAYREHADYLAGYGRVE